VWLTVLNRKIKTGPEDELSEVEGKPRRMSWIDAVVTGSDTESMTDANLKAEDLKEG
jgi:hypothetical protein